MNITLRMAAAPLLVLLVSPPVAGSESLGFDEAVSLATQNSPSISAQRASRDAAQSMEHSAGRLPDPRLILGIDNLPVEGPDQFSPDADFMTMRNLGVMQDVPNRARRQAQSKTAAATTRREASLLDAEIRGRHLAAAKAWLAARFAQDRVELVSRLNADYAVLEDATRGRLAAGAASAGDLLAIQQEALALEDQRDSLAANVAGTRALLDSLTGDSSGKPLGDELPVFVVDPAHVRGSIANHADIAPLSAEVSIAESELAEAKASRRGDWSWQLSYGKRGSLYEDMVSAEVTLDLPFWQSTRQRPVIAARDNAVQSADAQREEAVRMHRVELEQNLADLDAAERRLNRLRTQVFPLANQQVELAQSQYRSGTGSLAGLFDARRSLLMQQLREIDLQEQTLGIKAGLSYLIAGEKP